MEIKDLSGALTAIYDSARSRANAVSPPNMKTSPVEQAGSKTVEKSKTATIGIDGSKLSIGKGTNLYDILDISDISVRLAREITKFKNATQIKERTDEELFAAAPEISDAFVETIVGAGQAVEKPDESYDDLAWGMLVTIGSQIGLTDPDALMEVTAGDLAMYFDEKYHKTDDVFELLGNTDQNGNTVKVYDSPEDIWKDIFLTDEKGEFVRGNGGAVIRNKDFERTQSSVGYLAYFSASQGAGARKLSDTSPDNLLTFALAVERGDSAGFSNRFFFNSVGSSTAKSFYFQQVANLPQEEKMKEYKRQLAGAYLHYKENPLQFASPEGQHQEMLDAITKHEEKWITYKPFQGKGIYDHIPEIKIYNK